MFLREDLVVGDFVGTFREAGEKVRRHFVITHFKRASVSVSPGPSSVVASGDAQSQVGSGSHYGVSACDDRTTTT